MLMQNFGVTNKQHYVACVASVSSRVIVRNLEREHSRRTRAEPLATQAKHYGMLWYFWSGQLKRYGS